MKVFGVDYPFLSCGSVFTDGLVHAAADLGVPYAHAQWDDPTLSAQIDAFAPDLLFVVHGRRLAERYRHISGFSFRTAVWLLDEPYEVDDTARFAARFDAVFVNDPATLGRHTNATYLPVCYDPHTHFSRPGARLRDVGFIGGGNINRDRVLGTLARAGLLSYVVGGRWSDPAVDACCLSPNIPAAVTADLYRETRIVVNVFRETHHFNRDGIPATAMNPRIYEALACGALVISEWREEIAARVPELPTFRTEDECVELVRTFLREKDRLADTQAACAARLAGDTYAARVRTVLTTVEQAAVA